MKYLLTLLVLPVALALRGSSHGRKTEGCSDITLLHPDVLGSPFTHCCSHSDCENGERCKYLAYYLQCVPADDFVEYYHEVCNEEPLENSTCGQFVETRKPECVPSDEVSEAIFEHVNTECRTNGDCDQGVDCVVMGETFCLCDKEKHYTNTSPAICNIVDTGREGDDESESIDTTTSDSETSKESAGDESSNESSDDSTNVNTEESTNDESSDESSNDSTDESTLECLDITLLHPDVLGSPFTHCCSHSDCENGERCKYLAYYLQCVPADDFVEHYHEVCNEEPLENSTCGQFVETRKPECVPSDEVSEAIFEHVNTECRTNGDCDQGVDCVVMGETFCLCDKEKHYTNTSPAICNIVDTGREGDDESESIDTTTSDSETSEESVDDESSDESTADGTTATLPCVDPLVLLSRDDQNRIAFKHVSSNCRSSQNCGEGVECRVFGNNVFTACDQYNDFEGVFPRICHHAAP